MSQRESWQYCQIEVINNEQGILRQFFADRAPVEMQLYQNWPSMIGKLGIQGWEMISAVSGTISKNSIIYVFARQERSHPVSQKAPTQTHQSAQEKNVVHPPLPPENDSEDDNITFEPLRGL